MLIRTQSHLKRKRKHVFSIGVLFLSCCYKFKSNTSGKLIFTVHVWAACFWDTNYHPANFNQASKKSIGQYWFDKLGCDRDVFLMRFDAQSVHWKIFLFFPPPIRNEWDCSLHMFFFFFFFSGHSSHMPQWELLYYFRTGRKCLQSQLSGPCVCVVETWESCVGLRSHWMFSQKQNRCHNWKMPFKVNHVYGGKAKTPISDRRNRLFHRSWNLNRILSAGWFRGTKRKANKRIWNFYLRVTGETDWCRWSQCASVRGRFLLNGPHFSLPDSETGELCLSQ